MSDTFLIFQNKCLNGGTCIYHAYDNGTVSETCVCPANFSGPKCEKCASIECLNGGTCRATTTSDRYRCTCLDGFEGLYCEIDKCKGYCKNPPSICVIKPVVGPTCICDDDFSGTHCEIDDLKTNCQLDCKNNGVCRKESGGRGYCECAGEWSGPSCETPPPCSEDKCGKCDDTSSINECT